MAVPTNLRLALSNVFPNLVSLARDVRQIAASLSADAQAGNISITRIVNAVDSFASARERIIALMGTPGLEERAVAEYGSGSTGTLADWQAMIDAVADFGTTVINAAPKDGNGTLLERAFDANGHFVLRTLTPAQTATLRVKLDAIVATTAE